MHPSDLISPAATLLVGSAAWVALHLDRRKKQRADEARWDAVDAKLTGRPAVLDNNGEEIVPEIKSFSEEITDMRAELLARPALNGQFNALVRDVKRLREWTEDHSDLHDRLTGRDR